MCPSWAITSSRQQASAGQYLPGHGKNIAMGCTAMLSRLTMYRPTKIRCGRLLGHLQLLALRPISMHPAAVCYHFGHDAQDTASRTGRNGRRQEWCLTPLVSHSTVWCMTSLPSLLTANEVAEEFRLDPETIRRWARDGQIKSIRLPSGLYRFRREDIEALIAGREPVESGERAS